jgi:starch synthase
MFGIRNGIDQELWDPSIDEHLPQNYGPEDVVQGKAAAKRELRRRGNLADVDVPVVSGVLTVYKCTAMEILLAGGICRMTS